MRRDTLQDWEFRRDEWEARERGMENFYNELAESVLTAPIEDLEEEIRAEGRDPDKVAEEVREVMKSAITRSKSMVVKVADMTNEEVIEDITLSLASEICDGEYDERHARIRKLLIEFAEEVKRQAIEP